MTWTRDLDADERDAAELTAGLIDRQRVDLTTVCRAAKALPEYIAHVRELETEVKRLHGLLLGEGEVKHMTYSPENGCDV